MAEPTSITNIPPSPVGVSAPDAPKHEPYVPDAANMHEFTWQAVLLGDLGGIGVARRTNRAGGLEGGITNGEPVVVRAYMKPISTLMRPLGTVDLATGESAQAVAERSDVTAVPAMGVIAEAMLAFILADAMMEKFGGDSLGETKRNYEGYLAQAAARSER